MSFLVVSFQCQLARAQDEPGETTANQPVQVAPSAVRTLPANQAAVVQPAVPANVRARQVQMAMLGTQCATIICGLPGDEEHRVRLTTAIRQLLEHGPDRLGFNAERIRLLVGDEEMVAALQDLRPSEVATKESIQTALQALQQESNTSYTQWVFLLGHGNLDGKNSFFNIQGPDIHQRDFAEWWKAVPARFKIVWLNQPTSGFWIRALSANMSVVVSATEVGLEITGTEMAYALGDVLANTAVHQKLEDVDEDGALSLFDLYLSTCLEVAGRFTAIDRLQTEHALLEDNGDGRGRELQRDYLPDAIASVLSIKNRVIPYGRDGGLARLLPIAANPPSAADATETDEASVEESETDES